MCLWLGADIVVEGQQLRRLVSNLSGGWDSADIELKLARALVAFHPSGMTLSRATNVCHQLSGWWWAVVELRFTAVPTACCSHRT